jgi:methionyl-tRNA synthetase
MYVWLDALSNYITVLNYPDQDISDWWPAALQVIGKDIARFHIGIWPAILLGLGLQLPKTFVIHGHISVNGAKMSKSTGNVINPIEILDKHGTEPFRYYFLRHVQTTDDADFSWEKFESAYNELANDLGNLVQRLSAMCQKYEISGSSAGQTSDNRYDELMYDFEFSLAFDYIWTKIQSINKAIDDSKPWEIAKNGDQKKLTLTMSSLVENLLSVSQLLIPFLPETSQTITQIFSTPKITPPTTPLFPKS